MTHYDVSYKGLDRVTADKKAIKDIFLYVGDTEKMQVIIDLAKACRTAKEVQALNMSLAMFLGVSGYPFHALARKYCLAAYREWMHDGTDSVPTDEEGFSL